MARPNRTELEKQLRWICGSDPKTVYLDPNGPDVENYFIVSRICKAVESNEWNRGNRTGALLSTLERAIDLMPDKKHPDSSLFWREIARILFRFDGGLEPRADGRRHTYPDYVAVVERNVEIPPGNKNKNDWLKTQITGPCRTLLADALLKLEKQVIEGEVDASNEKESEPVNDESETSDTPPSEHDSPRLNQNNYGLFTFASNGPASITLKRSVFAGGLAVALVVAVLLATNPWSRSSDDPSSSESNTSAGSVEAEDSSSGSESSGAPAIRAEQVLVAEGCFGGTMIPNKTIQEIEALDEEIEERGLFNGTPEGTAEANELRGSVASVIGVAFTVHASRETPVVINKIDADIKESAAPPGVILQEDCGDAMPSQYTRLNLDSKSFDTELPTSKEHPMGASAPEDIASMLNYYELVDLGLPFEISHGQPANFLIVPTTEKCWCEWTLSVEWSSYEDEGTIVFDNDGEPFVTVSPSQLDSYRFSDQESGPRWVPEEL